MAYKSNSNKFWTGFLAVLLALVLAGTAALVGVLSDGFKNWDKFKTDEEQTEQTEETADNGAPVTDENGNELDSGAVIPMAKAMTFRSAASLDGRNAAYDSVTVNATVEPAGVELKSFTFTAEWVNPASEWATGKTVSDYFTVTQSGANSLQATLQCLQPFGEQIKVIGTGTSLDDETASAECTVDFAKRVIGWDVMFFDGPPAYFDETTENISFNNLSIHDLFAFASFDVEYSAYTIDDDITLTAYLGVYDNIVADSEASVGIELFCREAPIPLSGGVPFLSVVADQGMNALNGSEMEQYVNPFIAWLYENRDTAVFYIRISGQSEYQTIEKQIPVKFSASGLVISIESVSLDQNSVII